MTARDTIEYTAHYAAVMKAMTGHGLLVGTYDSAGQANLMTIGWGGVSSIWGVPLWTILVRPSRYTYRGIEHTGCFTVNVPGEDMGMACVTAGSRSGREINKFAELGLEPEKATTVLAPVVPGCPVVYECRVIHSNDILPAKLADEIVAGNYVDGDFHRVYFGEILAAFADPNAEALLR